MWRAGPRGWCAALQRLGGRVRVPSFGTAIVTAAAQCSAYYPQPARAGRVEFFKLSALIRLSLFAVLVAAQSTPPVLLAFSAVDAASGVWTLISLRSSSPG